VSTLTVQADEDAGSFLLSFHVKTGHDFEKTAEAALASLAGEYAWRQKYAFAALKGLWWSIADQRQDIWDNSFKVSLLFTATGVSASIELAA
jgi:hypothetical protein